MAHAIVLHSGKSITLSKISVERRKTEKDDK
jgi:hypothetical protein